MTIEEIRRAYQREPFQPIRLFLVDGRSIDVPHREFMWIPPRNQRTFSVADQNGVMEWVDLLLVVSIKELNGRGDSNGESPD